MAPTTIASVAKCTTCGQNYRGEKEDDYDDHDAEIARLREQLVGMNQRVDEHQGLVESVEEHREIQRRRDDRERRREQRRQANVFKRTWWWLAGTPSDDDNE